jgi:enoyl-CoA hydratase/carnithine racemase
VLEIALHTHGGPLIFNGHTHEQFVGFDKFYREGKKVLMNILDIEVPMIAALNGPVRLHSEYALLADVVLATPEPSSRTSRTSILASCPVTASTCCDRRSSAACVVAISF